VSDSVQDFMRGLLQDFGNDRMGELRSEGDGHLVNRLVSDPESDGVGR